MLVMRATSTFRHARVTDPVSRLGSSQLLMRRAEEARVIDDPGKQRRAQVSVHKSSPTKRAAQEATLTRYQ
jgi:hypothetical protein